MGEVLPLPLRRQEYSLQLAAGAEDFVVGQVCNPEYFDENPEFSCFNADAVVGIAQIRTAARQAAYATVEKNMDKLREGHFEDVPLDVDAMGTIAKVEAIGAQYGKTSSEYKEAKQGWKKDCQRKVAEIARKNGSEYFPITVQTLDQETDDLIADGLSVSEMLANGLTPLVQSEETDLRVNDYVRMQTLKALVKLPHADKFAAVGVRLCPDWAIKDLAENPNGAHGGYVPEIEKAMVDYDSFDPVKGEVYHEQIAVPGSFYTEEVVSETYRRLELIRDGQLTKTEVHNTVGLANRDKICEATDFLALLDDVASEMHGFLIFMGERVADNHPRDYAQIKVDAARRREEQEALSEELAAYGEELHGQNTERVMATLLVEVFLKNKMLEAVAHDPKQAAMVFNEQTALGFRHAIELEAQGRFVEAQALRKETELAAPPVSSCGAGSCGLEGVNSLSEEGKALKEKLQAKDGDTIVKDKERSCKCGKKEVVYAYNKNKVNKLCQGCGAFESKVTSGAK